MTLPMLTDKEIAAVQRRMRTAAHARRVRALEGEMKGGRDFTVSEIAKRLALPAQIIIAIYWQYAKDEEGRDIHLEPDSLISHELLVVH
jgi:hypothetical protein